MLLSLLCPDTRIICRASKLLLSRTDTAVDLIQWLVYSRESSQSTEIVFINDPRVFLPRGELQYQTLSDSLKLSRALGLSHSKFSDGWSFEESNGSSFCLWFLSSSSSSW